MILFVSQSQVDINKETHFKRQMNSQLTKSVTVFLLLTKKKMNAFVGCQACQYYFTCCLFNKLPQGCFC